MGDVTEIFLRVIAMMAVILVATRIFGLRSFSKMSGFDFSVTVAVGSVLAGAVTAPDSRLWVYMVAIVALFVFQMALAPLRARFDRVERVVDNAPLMVMEDGRVLSDNLIKADMTHADLWAKLRAANALDLSRVRAVVVESTGDVSVLRGPQGCVLSDELLAGVRR